MNKLALYGGEPVIKEPLKPYISIGDEEINAVDEVMKTGKISGFVGAWCDEFNGGPKIQELENAWSNYFGVEHSISVNSNTSGLIAALGASEISPGDEVIIPAWSMSATAIAPIFYGAIPVFADIDEDYFCINPQSVRKNITNKTKAIIAVNLFGHPAQLHELKKIAENNNLVLIEDNAQAPLAKEDGIYSGLIGDIGVFSLNYHKHIHTGEGGICTTGSDELAFRIKAIRNHGENIVDEVGIENITNLIGYNFRMTELSAAIGLCQLSKASNLISKRIEIASRMSKEISELPGFTVPKIRKNCSHVYYVWAAKFNEELVGVSRELFAMALEAEGCPISIGYVEPLYYLPVFKKKIAIGSQGFPFNLTNREYHSGLCPVTESLYRKELIELHVCSYQLDDNELNKVIDAYKKVYELRDELRKNNKTEL
jgi:perosamine synthetase